MEINFEKRYKEIFNELKTKKKGNNNNEMKNDNDGNLILLQR